MPHIERAPLTASQALTAWRFDVVVLVALTVLAVGYLAGVRRVRAAGQPWPAARTWLFIGLGLGGIAVATMSFLGSYDRTLFWPEAVQNIVLLTVIPLLL